MDQPKPCIVVGSYERLLHGLGVSEPSSPGPSGSALEIRPLFAFPAHIGVVKCVAVGGRYLASGGTDEMIRVYDLKKRKELGTLMQHQATITALAFHEQSHLLSAGEDGKLCIWRAKDWECLKSLKGHKCAVRSIAVHPSGKLALSVATDRNMIMWNLLTGHKSSTTKLQQDIDELAWNASGSLYAMLGGRSVLVYGVERLLAMAFCLCADDDEYLAAGGEDRSLHLLRLRDGAQHSIADAHSSRIKGISAMNIGDRTVLCIAGSDGRVRTLDAKQLAIGIDQITPLGEYDTQCRLTCLTTYSPPPLHGAQ